MSDREDHEDPEVTSEGPYFTLLVRPDGFATLMTMLEIAKEVLDAGPPPDDGTVPPKVRENYLRTHAEMRVKGNALLLDIKMQTMMLAKGQTGTEH